MTRLLSTLALAGMLIGMPASVRAHDAYDDSESHPLRIAAYALHPVGWALEWIAFRPLHFVVSQPRLEPIFGHVPHESPFGHYQPYEPGEEQ